MIPASWTQQWLARSERERLFLLVGGLVLVLTTVFLTVVDPLLEYSDRLDRQVTRKTRALTTLTSLRSDYSETQARLEYVEQRLATLGPGNRSLLAILEEATQRAHVRERIASMQPHVSPAAQGYRESSVELRLDDITWPQLLGLLLKLEEPQGLTQVKRLQVRPRYDQPHLLNVTFLVSTYERE